MHLISISLWGGWLIIWSSWSTLIIGLVFSDDSPHIWIIALHQVDVVQAVAYGMSLIPSTSVSVSHIKLMKVVRTMDNWMTGVASTTAYRVLLDRMEIVISSMSVTIASLSVATKLITWASYRIKGTMMRAQSQMRPSRLIVWPICCTISLLLTWWVIRVPISSLDRMPTDQRRGAI